MAPLSTCFSLLLWTFFVQFSAIVGETLQQQSVEMLGGEQFCFSGRGETIASCPSEEKFDDYKATYLDGKSKVTVTLRGVAMSDEGRHHHYDDDLNDDAHGSHQPPRSLGDAAYTIQAYLMPMESFRESVSVEKSSCCWQISNSECDPFAANTHLHSLPFECSSSCSLRQSFPPPSTPPSADSYVFDVSLNAPASSLPEVKFDLTPKAPGQYVVLLSNCALRVSSPPPSSPEDTIATVSLLTLKVAELEVAWTFSHGTLPYHLIGLIPFFGVLGGIYTLLSLLWLHRTCSASGALLGLQRGVATLIYLQTAFSWISFAYYVHLNSIHADVASLYSGTAAALVGRPDAWSVAITSSSFLTTAFLQYVVTLAADGSWLVSHKPRRSTKAVVFLLLASWLAYALAYPSLDAKGRQIWTGVSAGLWLLWLFCSIRRSAKTLRSLTIGDGGDVVTLADPLPPPPDAGSSSSSSPFAVSASSGSRRWSLGAPPTNAMKGETAFVMSAGTTATIALRRDVVRQLACCILVYPVVFLSATAINNQLNKEEWGWPWVGYALTDIYVFVVLLHATKIWIPTRDTDRTKYSPVVAEDAIDDDFGDFEMGGVQIANSRFDDSEFFNDDS